jgi:hypothetical protein
MFIVRCSYAIEWAAANASAIARSHQANGGASRNVLFKDAAQKAPPKMTDDN